MPVQSTWLRLTRKRTPPPQEGCAAAQPRGAPPAGSGRPAPRPLGANLGFQFQVTKTSRGSGNLHWALHAALSWIGAADPPRPAELASAKWTGPTFPGLYHRPIYRNSFRRSRPILIVRPLGRAERRGWGAPRRRLESGGIPATGSTIRSFLFGICSASRSTRCSPSTSPCRPPPLPTGSCSTP